MAIVKRSIINRPLTADEIDGNFSYLEDLIGTASTPEPTTPTINDILGEGNETDNSIHFTTDDRQVHINGGGIYMTDDALGNNFIASIFTDDWAGFDQISFGYSPALEEGQTGTRQGFNISAGPGYYSTIAIHRSGNMVKDNSISFSNGKTTLLSGFTNFDTYNSQSPNNNTYGYTSLEILQGGIQLSKWDENAPGGGNQNKYRTDIRMDNATGSNIIQLPNTNGTLALVKYKVYTAVLNQTSTNTPTTLALLENTIGDIVWSYISTGVYRATLTGAFTTNKVACFITDSKGAFVQCYPNDVDSVTVACRNTTGPVDGVLSKSTIEIRVYN